MAVPPGGQALPAAAVHHQADDPLLRADRRGDADLLHFFLYLLPPDLAAARPGIHLGKPEPDAAEYRNQPAAGGAAFDDLPVKRNSSQNKTN